MNRKLIYLAGPLFSIAEQNFNNILVDLLSDRLSNISFVLPQNYAKSIKGKKEFLKKMFDYCVNSIDQADAVLCVLDGPDVDSGTAMEIGYSFARKKPIVGIRTDIRSSEDRGVNLMLANACTEMLWLPSNEANLEHIVNAVATVMKHILE